MLAQKWQTHTTLLNAIHVLLTRRFILLETLLIYTIQDFNRIFSDKDSVLGFFVVREFILALCKPTKTSLGQYTVWACTNQAQSLYKHIWAHRKLGTKPIQENKAWAIGKFGPTHSLLYMLQVEHVHTHLLSLRWLGLALLSYATYNCWLHSLYVNLDTYETNEMEMGNGRKCTNIKPNLIK